MIYALSTTWLAASNQGVAIFHVNTRVRNNINKLMLVFIDADLSMLVLLMFESLFVIKVGFNAYPSSRWAQFG